ncbi:hypothetical protein LTX14_000157 [Clostridium perfringens]|uniref:hypothetical protein n=1 Tax=Clostridium perfringens TaxID=1502 RepID=UPI001240C89A|nr:hypothetical protein [Clostridium perfringens]EJT6340074.1 hypothetical protein [Clostridium perfringens]ELQ0170704.1 hypothetical protein [Clostridium perfringens]MDU7724110.1 hypothetical protein [Clostridium perfringens]UBK99928.1 hypothetical protein KLF26_12090 [Clostridium perfringens]CAJ1608988.1 hypothetical protein CLO5623_00393 [Clostridium perfringens]
MDIDDINILMKYLSNLPMKEYKKRFTFLGEGIARKVFALNKNLVVKVAKGEDGFHQNFVESYIFKNAPYKLKRYLCPVLLYNKRILIMPRAEIFPNIRRKTFVDLKKLREENSIEEDIYTLGEKYFLFKEDLYVHSSWGIINDTYYLIDYGCTSEEGDLYYDLIMKINGLL